jgi:selenocysteine-specific elongation factor
VLDDVLAYAPPPLDIARPRLWVDRVFAAKGSGTIVTGTLTGGSLAVDEEVLVEPRARRARVRRIESQHERLPRAEPGARVALNLAGLDHSEVRRGDAVVRPDQWAVVSSVDVRVVPVPGRELPRRALVDAHVGSGEQRVTFRRLREEFGRVRFAQPVPLAPGDRIVLRSSGAQATVAGGEVLDVAPARRTVDALARLALPLPARVLAARPWCARDEFERLAGRAPEEGDGDIVGSWLVAGGEVARVRARAEELARDGWPPITTVAAACGVDVAQLRAALGDMELDAATDDPAAAALLAALDASPFGPPAPSDVGASPALVRALLRSGVLVDLDGVIFSARAVEKARRLIGDAVVARGELTVAELRDVLGSTRKFVLPLVNRMDADGVTRRRGDVRVPGPRARTAR